jgi:hypothetical protein
MASFVIQGHRGVFGQYYPFASYAEPGDQALSTHH